LRTTITSYLTEFWERGNQTAFVHRRGLRMVRWSYRKVATTAYQFARELEARNIGKADRVLLWAGNSPEWVAGFFGCLLRGAIVVPLELQGDLPFVTRVQEQVNAKLVLCDATTRPLIRLELPLLQLEGLSTVAARHSSAAYAVTNVAEGDTAEIIFTSGTTAEPKGVRITHRNLLANLTPLENEIKRYLKYERLVHPIRFLNLLPLSHVFGQFMGVLVPQLIGGEVFFSDSLKPADIKEITRRERISVIVGVPRILDTLREQLEREYQNAKEGKSAEFLEQLSTAAGQHFLRRWYTFRRIHRQFGWKFWAFISGGATLNPKTEEFWQRLGFAVIQGYGMTETASLISVNHPFKAGRGSIGRVMPGQEVKLAENGEILVRGKNVSPGYWAPAGEQRRNRAETETEASVEQHRAVDEIKDDEWFHTGDVGELDQQGNLFFKGRRKEVIVTAAGVNIYPEDIEIALNRHPNTKAGIVIEIESAHGPEPLAVLILHNEEKAGEVIAQANESLGRYQQLRRWFVWREDDFPRTATQKIRKHLVAERVRAHLNDEAGETPAVPARAFLDISKRYDALGELVLQVSGEATSTLDVDAQLGTDLKLDSLGRVELLSALEERYQVEIDEAAFTDATTLGDIEKILYQGKQYESAAYPYPRWQHRWPLNWLRIALLYSVVMPVIGIMGWPRVKGNEHLRDVRGPLIFVCNHVTMLDHALILFALPAGLKAHTIIAQDGELLRGLRHPPTGTGLLTRVIYLLQYFGIVLFFNVFSMPRKSGFRRSFAFAGEMIDRGWNLMIFPEGKRTELGAMNSFLPGTGMLIQQLGVPVIPFRIDGLWELKQAHKHFAWPGKVSVVIGQPICFSAQHSPDQIANILEERVRRL
jgi:long-chain acyl-CoA synthetase